MEITGTILSVLPLESGTSRAGNEWRKQGYVLVTASQYPKKVMLSFFGDKCDQYKLEEGKRYRVKVDIESREFNGRWYTDVNAWLAEEITDEPQQQQVQQQPQQQQLVGMVDPATITPADFAAQQGDDLPF